MKRDFTFCRELETIHVYVYNDEVLTTPEISFYVCGSCGYCWIVATNSHCSTPNLDCPACLELQGNRRSLDDWLLKVRLDVQYSLLDLLRLILRFRKMLGYQGPLE